MDHQQRKKSTDTSDVVSIGSRKHSKPIVHPVGERNIYEAFGPFSPATVAGDKVVYTSGQIGVDPRSGILVGGGPAHETKVVLDNLTDLLRTAGVTVRNVAKVTLYLTDMASIKPVLEVYKDYFREPCPALTVLQVTGLPMGATVQADAIGYSVPSVDEFLDDGKLTSYRQSHVD